MFGRNFVGRKVRFFTSSMQQCLHLPIPILLHSSSTSYHPKTPLPALKFFSQLSIAMQKQHGDKAV